jgi:D-alanyl-lipoteichoic acid acyltransferase DltB (MBOAT superfamily)
MLSTLLDYAYGFMVASPDKRKAKVFLALSIINNLGILAVFKYYNFFAEQFQTSADLIGWSIQPYILEVALPIGISFYTFHGLSYVFDIYRGKLKPVSNLVEYSVFVSFFPLLVAGPIERANHLLPQIQTKRIFNYSQAVEGCKLILWGMFKKIVIADSLAGIVDATFSNYASQHGLTLLLGAVYFSFQIYGDFSGYSDIAIGTAKLFGFELLSNFKFPYFSRDIAEFWRRWHISLSSWFRDYLYIPLGGSKTTRWKVVRNTFIIFIISGFWHGAKWNFLAWGFIHACGFMPLLLLNWNRKNVSDVVAQDRIFPTLMELINMITTFLFVTFAWIFFRADSINIALGYIQQIITGFFNPQINLPPTPQLVKGLVFITPLLIGDWYFRRNERQLVIFPNQKLLRYTIYLLMTLVIFFMFNKVKSFIYFQF